MNTETNTKTTTENAVDKKAIATEKRAAALAALAAHAWIGAANATFIANAASRHHKGRYTVSTADGGYKITPSSDGVAFFTARKKSAKMTADDFAAIAAAKANKPGRFSGRDFVANAGKIRGRYISLPVFAGSGDALQQALFSSLIINEI